MAAPSDLDHESHQWDLRQGSTSSETEDVFDFVPSIRTQFVLWLDEDWMACNNGHSIPYSLSALHRIPKETWS